MKRILSPFLLSLLATLVRAEIKLPAIISDHAVFQAGKPVAIWGWSEPGAKITGSFVAEAAGSSAAFEAVADAAGKWAGQLPALPSGAAGHLDIASDQGEQKTVNDVLIGEVWLGGGQSNMSYDIAGKGGGNPFDPVEVAQVKQNVQIAQQEADSAQPHIRYFDVRHGTTAEPLDDVKGEWVLVTSRNVKGFSAVAWNFGVALNHRLHVPIGLVVSAVGGTPVEAWMSHAALAGTSVGAAVFARHQTMLQTDNTPEANAKRAANLAQWQQANPTPELRFEHGGQKPKAAYSETNNYAPCRLYNAMIHGLEPYTLRGFIWFQGDGNGAHPYEYSEMFTALIQQWRGEWRDPQLPFYFVEMNNMNQGPQKDPVEFNSLSVIREQQHGALRLPAVGMVAAIDLGTPNAHFPNKKPVGERLAGLALRDCYGQKGQVESPLFQGFTIEHNQVRLKFSAAEGLRIRGGALKGFAIKGATGNWVWATGKIEGEEIVVWSDQVPAPTAVRYGWSRNPITSVENGAGLPLFPFRTDTGTMDAGTTPTPTKHHG